ncbi:Sodium/glucose cotransporter 1 (Fragment) [Vulpes lagopus]
MTMPEYLKKRFGGFRIQLLPAILYLFLYIFNKILVEICTGAMFMRLVLGLDVYLATIVLLTITGIYTITGKLPAFHSSKKWEVKGNWDTEGQDKNPAKDHERGFAAVVYTDILHAIVMVLGSILVMGFVGGYQELLYKYPGSKPNLIHEGNWTAKPECFLSHLEFFHIFFPYPITGDFPWPGMSLASLPSPCTTGVLIRESS